MKKKMTYLEKQDIIPDSFTLAKRRPLRLRGAKA